MATQSSPGRLEGGSTRGAEFTTCPQSRATRVTRPAHARGVDWNHAFALVPTALSLVAYFALQAGFWLGWRKSACIALLGPEAPRVSVLKPLAGVDDELAENLATFAALDYPSYEVLLGVASLDDAAFPVARELLRRHPELDARIVVTDPAAALNPKVAQLIGLERAATGQVLVISDSNVRVSPAYLRDLVTRLSEPGVGLVSSAIVGTGERSTGAALENLQLVAFVTPVVLASQALFGMAVTIGKSMAMWRDLLAGVGGFRAVGEVLAEDHALAQLFVRAGHHVCVSPQPVYNVNVRCSVLRTVERHSRWAKLRRSLTPFTFYLEPLLFPVAIAAAVLAVAPGPLAAIGVAVAATCQLLGAFLFARALRGNAGGFGWTAREFLRTALLLACWARACLSRRVAWRGHEFELLPGSRIVPYEPRRWTRPRAVAPG